MRRYRHCRFVLLAGLFFVLVSMLPPLGTAAGATVTSIEISPDAVTLKPGAQARVTAVVKDENGAVMEDQDVEWTSSNENVAAVAGGLITAAGVGEATVQAACYGVTGSCWVTVEDPRPESIQLDPSSITMVAGSARTIRASVYDQFGDILSDPEIVWESEDENVATVEAGVVRAVSEGTANITAAVYDTGLQAVCAVKVVQDFGTKLVMVTGVTGAVASSVQAYHNLTEKRDPPYLFGLKVFSPNDLKTVEGLAGVKQAFLDADAILFYMLGSDSQQAINGLFSECYEAKWKQEGQPEILVQGSGEKTNDGSWAEQGFIAEIVRGLSVQVNKDDTTWNKLNGYISNGGVGNWERLLLYLATTFGDGDVVTEENLDPIIFSGAFAYHPAADPSSELYEGQEVGDGSGIFFDPDEYYAWYKSRASYNPDAPWAAIMTYDSMFKNADNELYLETLKAAEKKGLNAILFYPPYASRISDVRRFVYADIDGNGDKEQVVDVLICAMGFSFSSNIDNTIALFKELDVPVLTPIYSTDLAQWEKDLAGCSPEVYWQVAMPELEGRIEPVFMGGTLVQGVDEATGAVLTKNVALPDRMERLAARAAAWGRLRKASNGDKKIAIVYYNYGGGKDGIISTLLNVPRSLAEVLQAMKDAGYVVDEDGSLSESGKISEDKVFELMMSKGRNVGGWAPGELEELATQEGVIKIDLDTYLEWYDRLPQALRDKVESEWGPPPGQVMVHNGEIVIPGVVSGNVFFGPQPLRGWGEDASKILHSADLSPSHQYLAFYFWLQNGFKADAVVHFGTHGSAEWLPGKSVGLSSECWPDIVQGDMPNIYPYIVNNPGEATQAKRRGYAVTVDYLTPALANTELYGNLLDLHSFAHQYEEAVRNNDEEKAKDLRTKIMMILKDEGVAQEMGLDAENTPFEQLLDAAHDYLHSLESEVTYLGLHTFGFPPEDDRFEKTVQAIINYDPENRQAIEDEIRHNLELTTNEMLNLLRALEGRFIEPGTGKDPIRDPSVMPTGKNIKSFDPRTVPDRYAWEIGKKMADELPATYYQKHGAFPESVGVILWAIETMRTEGRSIAMIMRLLGIEPVWNAQGRVTSYKITPADELGRPRIDVVVTMSGLFRDTFSVVSELLDKAIRDLAQQEETPEQNYVKKHYDEIKSRLLSSGTSEAEASFLAASRVFSEQPGTYGNGMAEMMGSTAAWNKSEDLVEVYLTRASYIYSSRLSDGTQAYGQAARDVFVTVLSNVQAVVQLIDSTFGALDNDDVAAYLGGLVLASKWASGKEVDAYIANTRLGLNGAKIQSFEQFVAQELHSRLLNPKFIEEMLKEGYSGSATIAQWIGNTFYVDATTGAIGDWAWHQIAERYVFDENVRSQLNPYALQSLIGWAAEAARKGFWQASQEDLQRLSDVYIQTMVNYGVVCCHHTCSNIVFNEWLAQFSTLDKDVLKTFEQTLASATRRDVNIPVNEGQTENSQPDTSSRGSSSGSAQQVQTPSPVPAQQPSVPSPEARPTAEGVPAVSASTSGAGEDAGVPAAQSRATSTEGSRLSPRTESEAKPQSGKTAGETGAASKAYELITEGAEKHASGVTVWAVAGAAAATVLLVLGSLLRK